MLAGRIRRARKAAFTALTDRKVTVAIGDGTYRCARVYANALLPKARGSAHYEPWFKAVMSMLLAMREGVIVDVGANLGQTMLAALGADPTRGYIGFEPQIGCCQAIRAFIDENGLGHYAVLPVGLSDDSAILTLNSRKADDTTASLIAEYRPQGFHPNKTFVAVMRGDDALQAINPGAISVIKIDVEGAELAVLRGLSRTIAARRPAIVFELLPNTLLITGEALDQKTRAFRHGLHREMAAELVGQGYVMFLIGEDGVLHEKSQLIADEVKLHNYLAIAREDREALLALN